MKKRLTRGEKLLFASPLLFLVVAGIVWQRQSVAPEALVLPDSSNIGSMEFSPDSKRLVTFSQFPDAVVPVGRVYDVESRSVVTALDTPNSSANPLTRQPGANIYNFPVWSGDGTRISANTFRDNNNLNRIAIWDADSGKVGADYQYLPDNAWGSRGPLHFSPDGKTLIGEKKSTPIFEVATGKRLKKLAVEAGRIWSIKAAKGRVGEEWEIRYISEKVDRTRLVRVTDSKTKRLIKEFPVESITNYKWHEEVLCIYDIQLLYTPEPTDVHRLTLWNARTRQFLPSPPLLDGATNVEYAFNPDGKTLLIFSGKATQSWLGKRFDGEMALWDYRENRFLWRNRFSEMMGNFEWSLDGKWFAVLAGQPPKSLWHVFDKNGNLRLKDRINTYFFRFSPDSKKLAKYVVELDKMNNPKSSHIEIYRLED